MIRSLVCVLIYLFCEGILSLEGQLQHIPHTFTEYHQASVFPPKEFYKVARDLNRSIIGEYVILKSGRHSK